MLAAGGICPGLGAILCMWWARSIGWVAVSVAGGQAPLGDPIWRADEWPRPSPMRGWLIEGGGEAEAVTGSDLSRTYSTCFTHTHAQTHIHTQEWYRNLIVVRHVWMRAGNRVRHQKNVISNKLSFSFDHFYTVILWCFYCFIVSFNYLHAAVKIGSPPSIWLCLRAKYLENRRRNVRDICWTDLVVNCLFLALRPSLG